MSEDTQVLAPETEVMETESVTTEEIFQEYEVDMNAETSEVVEPSESEAPTLLRTAEDGCFEVYQGYWGKYIRRCFDPEANVEISKEHLEHFELSQNIHKLPAELWTRWVNLCFHYVDKVKSSVEVSVRILRSEEDPSKYRILVPRQVVSGAAVRVDTFEDSIDIETGEELTQYPPAGWIPVGSSHSHNTMAAFFSGTDDKYELGDPGIHLVVGGIKTQGERTYEIAASVVGSGRRFKLSYKELIDATPVDGVTFHPKVIDYVDHTSPVTTYTQYKGGTISKTNYSYSSNADSANYNKWLQQYSTYTPTNKDYVDPFYYNGQKYYDYNTGTYGGEYKNIKFWEVEDITVDYINQSQADINKLFALMDFLKGAAKDVEGMIDDMMYTAEA